MQRKGENTTKEGVNVPFTFRESLASTDPHPFVQVMINRSAVCAQVKSGWVAPDGTFLWAVSLLGPFYGSGSFPERLVRQCSGLDGGCVCSPSECSAPGAAADGVQTPHGEVTCM